MLECPTALSSLSGGQTPNPEPQPKCLTGSLFHHSQGDKDYLSRLLPIGHELCILPKTCLNTFGASQPVYGLGEAFEPGQGGSWSDPPQVLPTALDFKDVNYGPGGGLDL